MTKERSAPGRTIGPRRGLRVGLALGSGAARGWAHIGVIRALEEAGVPIHVVSGTSAGAVIGAFYAAGALETLHTFALGHRTFRHTFAYMDFSTAGRGLLRGARFVRYLQDNLPCRSFAELTIPLGVTATNLCDLSEVHLTSGALLPAVRASVAVPGFLRPEEQGSLQLVDGGLLNPVPVNVARRLGADIVIAVDLGVDVESARTSVAKTLTDVISRSVLAMSHRIRIQNRKEWPAEITIEPKTGGIRFMDFHKTEEAIGIGYEATRARIPEIQECIGRATVNRDFFLRRIDRSARRMMGKSAVLSALIRKMSG